MKVNIHCVDTSDEVYECLLFLCISNMSKEGRCNSSARGECGICRDIELEGLGIDVTDINTTLVGEKDGITLTCGSNANVEFGM